jgi:hypothetical protein
MVVWPIVEVMVLSPETIVVRRSLVATGVAPGAPGVFTMFVV